MSSLAECKLYDRQKKRRIANRTALLAALLAVALFNPWTFGLVDGLVGSIFGQPGVIATGKGRPTTVGLLVHTVVLFLVGFFLFYSTMKPSARPLVCCDPALLRIQA
jgi:uncharacterized BrkB/YihY/UPF0761 family membrane protein